MKLLRTALIVALAVASAACGIDMFKKSSTSPTEPSNTRRHAVVSGHVDRPDAPRPPRRAAAACNGRSRRRLAVRRAEIFLRRARRGQAGGNDDGDAQRDVDSVGGNRNGHQGAATCPFSMTGTGTFQGTSNIVLNYAGTSVQRAVQRIRNDQAIVTSLFR